MDDRNQEFEKYIAVDRITDPETIEKLRRAFLFGYQLGVKSKHPDMDYNEGYVKVAKAMVKLLHSTSTVVECNRLTSALRRLQEEIQIGK